MSDLLQPIITELSAQISDAVIARFKAQMVEIQKEQKLFWTLKELTILFNCSKSTVERRMDDGVLGYTRDLANRRIFLRRHLDEYFSRLEVRSGARKADEDSDSNVVRLNSRKTA